MSQSGGIAAARWLALAMGIVLSAGCGKPAPTSAEAVRARSQGLVSGPDLVITSVIGPATAQSGGFPVAVTACNQGTDPGPAYIDIVLSNDSVIAEPADPVIGSGFYGQLGPGQCITPVLYVSTNAPNGAYYIGAITDAQNQVAESNETNNALAGNVLGMGWGPDFVVRDLQGPTSASGSFNATVTVCNQGNAGASTNVDLFLSTDPVITTADSWSGSAPIGYLSPGQCTTQQVFASPPGLPSGPYYLGVIADAFNGTSEILETNNAFTGALMGYGPQPDLVVTDVTGPASTYPGTFDAVVTVCNQGASGSPGTNVELRVSTDTTIDSTDAFAGGAPVPPLAPGQCAPIPINASAPVPDGAYVLGGIVDPTNLVFEVIEQNNAKAGGRIGIGSRPDLVVTDVSGPTSASSGSSLNVTATVCNQGTSNAYGTYMELHLSVDDNITVDDPFAGSASVPTLTPGQCAAVPISGWVSAPDGVYYLGTLLDPGHSLLELDTANNARAGAQLGIGWKPDLVVTAVNGPSSVMPGNSFPVDVTVCNQGTQSGSSPVDIVLSTDAVITPVDTFIGSLPVPTLYPGQCVTQTANVSASPSVSNGTYVLGAIADSQGYMSELIKTNNALAGTPLSIGNGPDFVVSSVVGPPTAGSGPFSVTVTACNQGVNGGSTNVDLFLSGDTYITTTDYWIGSAPVGWLNPGQCATRTVSMTGAPPPGVYYVGGIADASNQVLELIETNNALAGNIVGVGSQPDLIVSAVSGPTSVPGGSSFSAQVTVCNQGQSSSPGTTVDLRLSSDNVISSSDYTAGNAFVNSLMPGQCVVLNVNGWAGVPEGTWTLGAFVDPSGSVSELFEANNGLAGGQVGVGFKPDLAVTDLSGPKSMMSGNSVTVTATVCNQGTSDAYGGTSLTLVLSTDATITTADTFVGSGPLPYLAAGQCAPVTLGGSAYVPDGTYYLGVIADTSNSIQELNEGNNTRALGPIGVGSKPDFVVTEVSVPPSVISGTWIPSLNVTVCNQGTQSGSAPLDIVLSSDTTITRADLLIGGASTPFLSPGQCAPVPVGVNISAPDGIWYVGVIVDSQNYVQELIETNNTLASSPVAVGNGPDFVVRSVVGPPTASSSPFNVSVTVCNQGTASGSTNVDLFQSYDTNITTADTWIGSTYVGFLSPGQCASRSIQVWPGPWGSFFLGAIADAQNQVNELVETNNSGVGGAIGVGSQPDLIVSSITAPPSALGGSSFTAQVTVCNQGQSPSASASVELRLSGDTTITSSDFGLGNAPVGSLTPGQCATVPITGWAGVPDGAWILGAIVDPTNSVMELFENNNAKAGPQLGVGSKPDFIISNVTAPPSITNGAPFTANVTVCNQGTVSGSTNVDVVFSTDTVINTSDPWIGGQPSGTLAPGQCSVLSIPVHGVGPDGAYFVGALADAMSSVPELNEGNNTAAGSRVGMGSYPDLVVTGITAPVTALGGSGFNVQVMVCNQGTTSSSGGSVDVVLSTDGVIDTTDTFIGSGPVTSLPPGQCYGSQVYANAYVADGTYTIGAVVDRQNQVFELIEDNNTFAGGEMGVGNGPDYYIAAISAPTAVRPGAPFTVQVTYCNQGTAPGPSVTLDLYQSPDATITTADTLNGGTTAPGLGVNQCATVPVYPATGLSGPDGPVFFGVIADRTNQVFELLEDNNNSSAAASAVDSVPPAAPMLTSTTPGSPSTSTTPVVQGTTEANATVQLYTASTCTGTPLATGVANGGGSFGVAVSVPTNKATQIFATSTDVAGNVSACSAAITFVNDTIAPTRPIITGFSPSSPSKSSTTPLVLGNAEPSSVVRVFKVSTCAGTPVATGTATSSGTFSIGVTVAANSSTPFYVNATDAAGNVSVCSTVKTYVHDNIAPATPAFTGTLPASPSNSSTTPSFQGTAESGAVVKLFTSSTCTGTAMASGTSTGTFSIPVAVTTNSATTLFASATDAAGNVSGCSAGRTYVHDATPPAAPVLSGTSPTSPSSSTSTSVLGTAEANASVQLFANGTCTAPAAVTGMANASGSFGLPVTVAANSTTTFSAVAIDAAGNVSACSGPIAYVHDATAPAVPVLSSTSPVSPSSASTTPLIQGTAEAGATVRLFTSSTCTGTAVATGTANGTGAFSLGVTVAANSSTTFFATASDVAGNTSACSAGLTYVHDTTPPAAPVLTSSVTGAGGTGQVVQGTAEANATVTLFTASTCSGTSVGAGTAGANNAFSVNANATGTAVNGGTLTTFFANATDRASNVSTCSAGLPFLACNAGRADCNGSTGDGCEVTLASDPNHCGTCSTVCGGAANAAATCNAGTCGFTCNAGFSDCDNNPANGCETAGSCPPPCATVDASRELLINDTHVVEDPVRTTGLGAWTFGKLMTSMAGGQSASAFVRSWLETWKTNQVVNGFTLPARPSIQSLVITPWETASGVGPGGALDLRKAPFRLLAIVNRVDLRNLPNNAGEGRFVFGVLDGNGNPLQFTVILEYKLPGTTAAAVTQWAQDWHALGQTPITDPTFNTKLQAITDRFAGPNLAPGAPNGSSIGQVRTNEIALAPTWQLREFTLNAAGALVPATVKQTPDLSFNNTAALANFINQNQTSILAGTFSVPLTFNSQIFLGGNADVPSPTTFWQAPGVTNNDARQQFSLNTCSGCHAGETGTQFLQISPRFPGQAASLSDFLTGRNMPKPDPVSGVPRTFNDLARRASDLQGLACGTSSPLTGDSGSASLSSLSSSSDSDSVPASNLPPSRVH